jgi:hypothetical protein
MRIIRICLCFSAAITAGIAAAAAIQLAQQPRVCHRMNLLLDNALGGGLFYALAPATILVLSSHAKFIVNLLPKSLIRD